MYRNSVQCHIVYEYEDIRHTPHLRHTSILDPMHRHMSYTLGVYASHHAGPCLGPDTMQYQHVTGHIPGAYAYA